MKEAYDIKELFNGISLLYATESNYLSLNNEIVIRAKIYEQPIKYIGTNKIINNFNGDIIVKPSSIMGRTGTFTIVSSNIPKYAYEILPEIIKVKFVQIPCLPLSDDNL